MPNVVEIEAAVDFAPLWGDPIEAVLLGIVETDDDHVIADVVMTATMFARVMATEAFALLTEALVSGVPEQLDPTQSVRLSLRLRPGVYAWVAHQEEEPALAVAQALAEEHPLSGVVRQSEAWLVCTATQKLDVPDEPDADAEIGIRTLWDPR